MRLCVAVPAQVPTAGPRSSLLRALTLVMATMGSGGSRPVAALASLRVLIPIPRHGLCFFCFFCFFFFFFSFFGGFLCPPSVFSGADLGDTTTIAVDRSTMERISGCCMDYLVMAAIIELDVSIKGDMLEPFLICFAFCCLWCIIAMVTIGRLMPDFWLERSLTELGLVSCAREAMSPHPSTPSTTTTTTTPTHMHNVYPFSLRPKNKLKIHDPNRIVSLESLPTRLDYFA